MRICITGYSLLYAIASRSSLQNNIHSRLILVESSKNVERVRIFETHYKILHIDLAVGLCYQKCDG